jgi:hypothetical protein
MSKTKNIKKLEKGNSESESSSDDDNFVDIQLQNMIKQHLHPEIINEQKLLTEKKEKRPYTTTDEQRVKMRERMEKARLKRLENTQIKKEKEQKLAVELLRQKEDEIKKKIIKKASRLKKQQQEELYQKLLEDDLMAKNESLNHKTKTKKHVVVYESSSDNESSSDEDKKVRKQHSKKSDTNIISDSNLEIQNVQPVIPMRRKLKYV